MNDTVLSANTVGQLLAQQATIFGDKPFVLFPEDETRSLSYTQVHQGSLAMSDWLRTVGVEPGQFVALLLPNIPEFTLAYWGCMTAGAVANPINTMLLGAEMAYVINHTETTVLITTAEFLPTLAPVWQQLPHLKHVLLIEDVNSEAVSVPPNFQLHYWKTISAETSCQASSNKPVQPNDAAMIIYTSGTTGKPKGVLLSHQNLLYDAHFIRHWFDFDPSSVFLCILPLFHVNGEVVTLMTPLYSGASVVLMRKFSASLFWKHIAHYGVSVFSTVPTILSILLKHGTGSESQQALNTLKHGICGAAPLPVEVQKQFEATFGVPIIEGYGLSETTCYSTFNPTDVCKRKLGSIGVAVGNLVAIWDENNQPVPIGQEGEIVISGPNVMQGYFKRPEETQAAFAGGWFHSGDWGKQDEDGFFYILDRVKDIIIRGGENITPREIDEVLYTHPAVESAATIGIPDALYGEEVKSFVVLHPGHTASDTLSQELLAYCQQHLAAFKCPKHIAFIDEIPKGPTGKLLRRVLREY